MWEELDRKTESELKSEKSENIEKIITTTNEEKQQQQTIIKTTEKSTTTLKSEKEKNIKQKQKLNNKPELNKNAKPKPNLTVKGKQISDIGTLRDFLAKKQLERAARVGNKDASHQKRSENILQRDQPTTSGEPTPLPNQIENGTRNGRCQGEHGLQGDKINWSEQARRMCLNQSESAN